MEKQTEALVLYRRIGSTLYRVGIHFNQSAKETLNEKICRLLKNELQSASAGATMKSLQAGCLSGRGAS